MTLKRTFKIIQALIILILSASQVLSNVVLGMSFSCPPPQEIARKCPIDFTVAPDSSIIQGLQGATVTLQHETVTNLQFTRTSDAFGEALFEDLPTGTYKARISANEHQEWIGRLSIKPGITASQQVFLDYNLVTVEWKVVPVTIEDKYEIILDTTFKTEVPAPVVICEPGSVTIPHDIKRGDVFNGEFKMTNYGLIQANNFKIFNPPEDEFFKYEILTAVPEILGAKESIVVPYRLICLQSLDLSDAGATGGGDCHSEVVKINYIYDSVAECEKIVPADGCFYFLMSYGDCTGSQPAPVAPPTAQNGGMSWSESTGGTITSGSPQRSTAATGGNVLCPPGTKCCPAKECCDNEQEEETKSKVNLFTGSYVDTHVDLSFKIPGNNVEFLRKFTHAPASFRRSDGGAAIGSPSVWQYFIRTDDFAIVIPIPKSIASVNAELMHDLKKGVQETGETHDLTGYFTPEGALIKELKLAAATPITYFDKFGNSIKYNEKHRPIEFTTRHGIKMFPVYDMDGTRFCGLKDDSGTQVFWITYNTDVDTGHNEFHITEIRDYTGRRVTYINDDQHRLTDITNVMNETHKYAYDEKGRLVTKIKPDLSLVNVSYNTYNYVTEVNYGEYKYQFDYRQNPSIGEYYGLAISPNGKRTEKWFNENGQLTKVAVNDKLVKTNIITSNSKIERDAAGNTVTKTYDKYNNLTQISYQDGSTVTYEYSLQHARPIKKIDEKGIITKYEYNEVGDRIKMIEAFGTDDERETTYTYTPQGYLETETRGGATTTMEYNANGDMTKITDPEGGVVEFTYDFLGNVLTRTQDGKVWTYEYDNEGKLKKTLDPLNHMTEYFYDFNDNRVKEIDPLLRETNYEYNSNNDLVKVTDSEGNFISMEYNQDGHLLRSVDQEGREINYEYNQDGQLSKTIDGSENAIEYQYENEFGGAGCSSCTGSNQIAKIIYPTFSKTFNYDLRGRKISETNIPSAPDTESQSSAFTYSKTGELLTKTDAENNTTQYFYDSLGRVIKTVDVENQEVNFTYDDQDNLISLKDPKGNETKFEYNKNRQVVKEIRPMGQETTYDYYSNGLLKEKVDFKGQKAEYFYDDFQRLEQIKYFESTIDVNPIKTVSFSYNDLGNLTGYDDGTTSAIYDYDTLNRKTGETVNYGPFSLSYAYEYYKNGLKKSFTNCDGIKYTYTYNENNQLSTIDIPGEGTITYNEYLWMAPKTVTLPGGSRKEFTYDPLMQIKQIKALDPGQNIIMQLDYTRDKVGNILTKQSAVSDQPTAYTYDKTYQLLSTAYSNGKTETFTYDPAGNRLSQISNLASEILEEKTYSHNNNNEILSAGDVTFEFDLNGSMTKKTDGENTWEYIYNEENRLSAVKLNGNLIAEYYYDPFGRRLWKDVEGSLTTYFFYSDEGLTAEANSTGAITKTYGFAPNSIWTTDPLWIHSTTQNSILKTYNFFLNDHLATPQQIISSNGLTVWQADYESFGEATVNLNVIENNLRFPGQYFDGETGEHYNWNRTYMPEIGRYNKVDPIGFMGGDTNLFSFVLNNSINYLDPNGKVAITFPILIIVAEAIKDALFYGSAILGGIIFHKAVDDLTNENESDKNNNDDECNPCGNKSRYQAMSEAYAWAAMTKRDRIPIPLDELNDSSRGPNFWNAQRNNARNLGHRNVNNPGGNFVFEHPDGHPALGVDDPNELCPHFHAVHPARGKAKFIYKRN